MRSVLLCVFLSFTAIRCWGITIPAGSFRPRPIPLEWHRFVASESRASRASDAPATPPVDATVRLPPHYWEDALRHSVYLTLVRDNIDALIARGERDSPQQHTNTRDLEDKDLWDKIKSAPFERITSDEMPLMGDVAIVSRGKMTEADGKYRFLENERESPECEGCDDGAKALWSVKRTRHREYDTPGRYRYELTFSVVTNPSKDIRGPQDNPARTFTVKESSPELIDDEPRENRAARKQRGERALWVHKNLFERDEWAPLPPQHEIEARLNTGESHRDTDRMFTSLFMDDEKPRAYHPHYEHDDAQKRYVNIRGPPQYSKQKKPLLDHQQKKLTPYPYKPHGPQKYSRPPPAHTQHHYLDIEQIGVVSSPYVPQPQDHRHIQHIPPKQRHPSQGLPQSLPPPQLQQQPSWQNFTESSPVDQNNMKPTPKPLEPIVVSTKTKPTTIRIGYITEHVRPPVYNTPPGVFVTMDKKPFKPLPPMKLHHTSKPLRPADFRPSPQVLDIQFSEPDPLFESFRPINVNYTYINDSSTDGQDAESTKRVENVINKENVTEAVTEAVSTTSAAPVRRTSRITTTSTTTTTTTTTTTPEPPTSTYDDIETMSWTNLLGAFTGTTPSDVPRIATKKTELSTEDLVSTNANPSTPTSEEAPITTTSSTTVKPTRPSYKHKVVKVKKHKRVTSTTPTAPKESTEHSTSTEQTVIPLSSTESVQRTNAPALRQVATTPATIPAKEQTHKTTNRYRMSTLMIKGTSVKHDKWSPQAMQAEQKPMVVKTSPVLGKYSSRRTESNFHGYLSPSTTESGHVGIPFVGGNDSIVNSLSATPKFVSTTESAPVYRVVTTESSKTVNEEANEESPDTDTQASDLSERTYHKQKQRTKAKLENLYRPRPSTIFSLKTNERMNVEETTTTTEKTIVTSPHSKPKNSTKCKKKNGKKPIIEKTTEEAIEKTTEAVTIEPDTITQTTPEAVTQDIFEELFGMELDQVKPTMVPETDKNYNEEGSNERDIFEDIFGTENDSIKTTGIGEDEPQEDRKLRDNFEDDFDYSESAPDDVFNDSEEAPTSASNLTQDETAYGNFSEPPYSFLELMAME